MTYELMVLVDPSVDMTQEKTQKALIEKLIGDAGKVSSLESLGKKQLAYPILKKTEATYLVAMLEGTIKADVVDKKSRLMDETLRILLTVKE